MSKTRNIYIDTQYLHAFIFPEKCDEDMFCKEILKKAIYNRSSMIQIPFVVVGETINNIKRKSITKSQEEDVIRNLLTLLERDNINLSPPIQHCFRIANEIKGSSHYLDDTDVLITAHALCDPTATHFLVNDEKILTSSRIKDINSKLKTEGFREYNLKLISEF